MKTTLQVDTTHLISQTFVELGVPRHSVMRLAATVLEHEGITVAKRYRAENVVAIWIIAEGVVRYYDTHGVLLRTTQLELTSAVV